jgi:tRNA dimethylallyltransferase
VSGGGTDRGGSDGPAGCGVSEAAAQRACVLDPGLSEADPAPASVVIGLLGPTAVGKTAVAAVLAGSLAVRVISCDSMQVYRGFPVLTNQPSRGEKRGVDHMLVGFVDPVRSFSAAEYAVCARPLIAADAEQKGAAVITGGTGLYLRAALAPLAVAPGDPEVRARLEARAAAEGNAALYAELAGLDPKAADAVDPRNARRVVRALEAVLVGGKEWSGRDDLWNPRYDRPTVVVGLTLERVELYARIGSRARRMVEEGAVDEVRRFREEHGREATAPGGSGIRSAIGYREICRHLDGELTTEEAAEQIAGATRRYVRRQLTWLRKLGDAVIIDVQDRDPEEIAREILDLALAKRTAEESRHHEAG